MAIIHNQFMNEILNVHDRLNQNIDYPFFDPACIRYEALRAALVEKQPLPDVFKQFGITEYLYRQALAAFRDKGVAGLIGLSFQKLTVPFDLEAERMIFILKQARPWVPATKMIILLEGFGFKFDLTFMRHLYASYGWAQGTKKYDIDFQAMNLKVVKLVEIQCKPCAQDDFFRKEDRLQKLIEVFRIQDSKEISKCYPGSRVSLIKHRKAFNSLGLLGLIEQAKPVFRNSKLGFKEEGWMILSKIQHKEKNEYDYQKLLQTKKINVDLTCIKKIFNRWNVMAFQSKFKGNLDRFLNEDKGQPEANDSSRVSHFPVEKSLLIDEGFAQFIKILPEKAVPLANPGIFLFLPLLQRLNIFDAVNSIINTDPDKGYSWFSLLLLNLGRILGGISSISKACRTNEPSFPLYAGLVEMPCKDSMLNGLAEITESQLLKLRRFLTQAAYDDKLVHGRKIALDFHMRDFTGDDGVLKNIGKGPSPKRKICFPGFRPHLAWDVATGVPISLEFRVGSARATTTFKQFVCELLPQSLSDQNVEHVYLDSEYTAQKVWHFIVDSQDGLGADLTMCIKQNRAVKKQIAAFLESNFEWLFYDEDHTYSSNTFAIPINQTNKELLCVLKKNERTGRLRCFGSTISGLDARQILTEYKHRWVIENGIKDLVGNYFLDNIPGINPHRINIHYFVVTLARILYQMFCNVYPDANNPDKTQKGIGSIRPEFIIGTNASLTRQDDQLILTWLDPYPKTTHEKLSSLFLKLNEFSEEPLPFLGGLKLKFETAPPKCDMFKNRHRRIKLDLG